LEFWNTKKSAELYGIDNWGANYFQINEKGNVEICPFGRNDKRKVDLRELLDDLLQRGLRSPVLIRFPDIVNSQIQTLAQAFYKAFNTFNYKGTYNGVFPIKVNQQRYLVEEMVEFGKKSHLGLEAGSKPELLIALAVMDNPNALLICNGFKDSEYIETALLARKLGRNTIIVVDRMSELPLIVEASKNLNIRPCIGFRAKLESRGAGKWVESSGAKSKFGLTVSEMLKCLDILKRENMLDCLQMLHFHIGSQITALRAIKDSLIEASRIYVELAGMGAGLKYIDVGGGLGVDYDGSQTNWENSVNYTIQEYANDVVGQICSACDEKEIPHPGIITEAGRALVAHHSVLVFDVLGSHRIQTKEVPAQVPPEDEHELLEDLHELYNTLNTKNLNEHLQDAFRIREYGMNLFNLGYFSLKQRALLEDIFWAFCSKVLDLEKTLPRKPEELGELKKLMHDSYYCNFSLFQSAPDMWAVGQLFPIMPIHRLQEEPTRRAVLLDLTCDSDGKIDNFIDIKDIKNALELHEYDEKQPYYIGMFLLGAYQEILGDFHNLFGDTDAVHVSVRETGYTIDHVVEGDSVTDVLGYVEYERPALIRRIRTAIEQALTQKSLSLEESKLLMRYYEVGLSGYTYLEGDNDERSEAPLDGLKKIGQKQIEAMKSMSTSSSGAF
jgi:arginine decarboxylase